MSWFDEERNSSSALTYQLADDAAKVQSATGSRLGTLLEIVFGLLTAIIISFVYSWPLTILILMMIPFIVLGDVLKTQALAGHSAINKKAMEIAGKVTVYGKKLAYLLWLYTTIKFYSRFKLASPALILKHCTYYFRLLWNPFQISELWPQSVWRRISIFNIPRVFISHTGNLVP